MRGMVVAEVTVKDAFCKGCNEVVVDIGVIIHPLPDTAGLAAASQVVA
jgi:hypothetical protein